MEIVLIESAKEILRKHIQTYSSIIYECVDEDEIKRSIIYIYIKIFEDEHSEGANLLALKNVLYEDFDIAYDSDDSFLRDVIIISNVTKSNITEEFNDNNIISKNEDIERYENIKSGYVYIAINSSIPNMVKVGMTKREPELRMTELSSATGVPTPYVLIYKEYFTDCFKAEAIVHELLEEKNTRVSNNREFFEIPVHDAIKVVQEVKNYMGDEHDFSRDSEIELVEFNNANLIEELIEKGEDCLEGYGLELQNFSKGFMYLEKAIKLGSGKACWMIGKAYMNTFYEDEGLKLDISKSLEYFEKGMRLDDIRFSKRCTAEIALILSGQHEWIDSKFSYKYSSKNFWKKYIENLTLHNFEYEDIYYLRDYIEYFLYEVRKYDKNYDSYLESFDKINWFKYQIYDYNKKSIQNILSIKHVPIEKKNKVLFTKKFLEDNYSMSNSILELYKDSEYIRVIFKFIKKGKDKFEMELRSSHRFEVGNIINIFMESISVIGVILETIDEQIIEDFGYEIHRSIFEIQLYGLSQEENLDKVSLDQDYEVQVVILGDYFKTNTSAVNKIESANVIKKKGFLARIFNS